MESVSFDLFVSGLKDVESTRYRLLAYLQGIRDAFSRNVIYPHLSDLVSLHNTLAGVAGKLAEVRESTPGRLAGVDLTAHRLIYEKSDLGLEQLDDLEGLIEWALPRIRTAIEEGRAIFEFVDENVSLEQVGIVPSYVEEGYLLVPDHADSRIHVVRYRMSIFSGAEERFRTLRTTHVSSIEAGLITPSPAEIKLRLTVEHEDLPNPSTFFLVTELDFPFKETVLPVAKRKLIQNLSTPGQ
jgi:hypothetical protein